MNLLSFLGVANLLIVVVQAAAIIQTTEEIQQGEESSLSLQHDGPTWSSHPDSLYVSHSSSWWPGFQHRHFAAWDPFFNRARDELQKNSDSFHSSYPKSHKLVESHHMIKMRDGVRLSTYVVRLEPKHRSMLRPSVEKRAALLARSPYGPTSDQIADIYMLANGMVAVIQDQRGTFHSEGEFSMWADDATDGYDTMEWISQQEWSNGEVFTAGLSADGCGAFTQLLSKPKWLKGQFLLLASATGYETMYPGGAFREGLVEGWMSLMSMYTRGKSLTKTLPSIKDHEAKSSFYDSIEATGHYQNVNWPSVHLASWWDIFQIYHINAWEGYSKHSQLQPSDHRIFISPLGHCSIHTALGATIPIWSREKDEIFHEDLIADEAKGWVNAVGVASEVFAGKTSGHFLDKTNIVNMFVQGPIHDEKQPRNIGNYWTSLTEWPRHTVHKYILAGSEGSPKQPQHDPRLLLKVHPSCNSESSKVSYQYDPEHPVVTRGGNNLVLAFMPGPYSCGSQDQRPREADHRQGKDLVSFTSQEPFEAPVAVVGKIKAVLYVSGNRNDTDFTATLSDVYPDGRSMLVRYGIQRMKWREQPTEESPPMEQGKVYKVEIDMWATAYIFDKGHKLRLTVTSSNSPFYLVNPNDDRTIEQEEALRKDGQHGLPRQGVVAENTIHFSDKYPSHVQLPIVSIQDIPKNEKF